MQKQKWLKQEIDNWVLQGQISHETALRLKSNYPEKEAPNTLFIIFSIIGAVLIGAGLILIFARNWYQLPIALRVVLSFIPLLAGQALAVFVTFKRRDSLAWREGVAIFLTLAVFANLALIDQIFHLSAAFGNYILSCALLSLPIIYILDAVSPVIVYTWAILNWAALNTGAYAYEATNYRVWWLLLLILLIAPYFAAKIKHEREGVRGQLLVWAAAIGGFFAMLFLNSSLSYFRGDLLAASLCFYFSFLYAWGAAYEKSPGFQPLKIIGALGAFTLFYIYSYFGAWQIWPGAESGLTTAQIPHMILSAALLVAALWLLLRSKRDALHFTLVLGPMLLGLLLVLFHAIQPDGAFGAALFANALVLGAGLLIILRGIKKTAMLYTNLGMIALCLLIILRFFDWEMDFLARGIAFVLLGAAFLGLNLFLIKKRKAVASK